MLVLMLAWVTLDAVEVAWNKTEMGSSENNWVGARPRHPPHDTPPRDS